MQMKKVVSLIMVVAMLLTVCVIPGFSAADADTAAAGAMQSDYALAPNVQSGNILHAFNWRMRDLVKYAPEIAQAGYSSVQISPIQATKATTNDGSYATDWWCFYQPTDMTVGNALGTAAELQAATAELHKYGVKVVADVVTNHAQNCESKKDRNKINATFRSYLRHDALTHPMKADDSSRQNQVQGDLDNQLPDANTGSSDYQSYVVNNLINPLSDAGVDGFRFDAAKHIETPSDGSLASQYWPTVTNAIKAKNSGAYIYGEILDSAGKFQINAYTPYINVTDWAFGNTVRGALSSKNASGLINYGYSGSSKNQNVLWLESHDNFCSGASTGLTKQQQILGWAVVGSRADAPALFYVRPKHEAIDSAGFIKYDDLMGAPGSADTWKDPTVVAVNKFKNAFVGQAESTSASGSNLFVQRGTTGMVIVNLNGSSTSVNQSCTMANGTYKDQVSGANFTVSGGKITGNVGSTGVAVVYNTTAQNSAPTIDVQLDGTTLTPEVLNRYTAATATVKVNIGNATGGSIKVSNLDAVAVNNGTTTFTLNSSIPYGKSVDITVTATNGTKTVSRSYNVKKKNANEAKKVYFDNSVMKWPYEDTTGSGTVGIFVMCKTGIAANTKIGSYDSHKMTPVSGQEGLYSYTVPNNTNYVKFNEGFIGSQYTDKAHVDAYDRCHLFHSFSECGGYCGRTMPETVVNYGTANSAANRENGGYELTGAMILRDLRFEDYGEYPVATLSAADTSLGGETPTIPTQTPTEAPTEPPVGVKLLRGDADLDDEVSILDVTLIQRHIADISHLAPNGVIAADVDGDDELAIIDATYIQRYLAGMSNPKKVAEYFYAGGVAPTEPATQPATTPVVPTEAPTESGDQKTLVKLSNKFVAVVYCEAAGTSDATRNSEHNMDDYGRLTYDFIGPSYVFVRNYNTGVQYCTDGWSNFQNPVTLVNQANLTSTFDKMYVPAGTHTLYLQPGEGDTYTLEYDGNYADPGTGGNTDPTQGGSGGSVSFLLTDNFNWGSAYVYAWDANGNKLNGEWPGASQAETVTNEYGETQFRCYVPQGAVGVILNNGNGAQTEDITDFSYAGFWMDGSKNEKGHYIVTGWN